MIFHYDQLTDFLSGLGQKHNVVPLGDWDGSRAVILRHDVDLAIAPAYRMAEIELQCHVRSSFFILTTRCTYNPMDRDNRRMLRAMAAWGFEIGLHFDPTIYGDATDKELQQHAEQEAAVISAITGQPVRSISIHNPSVHGHFPIFDGFKNAYDPEIFTDDCYISDSRMQFKKDIHEFVKRADEKTIQILLHPLHFSKTGGGYEQIFGRAMIEHIERVDADFQTNQTYRETIEPDLLSLVVDRARRRSKAA